MITTTESFTRQQSVVTTTGGSFTRQQAVITTTGGSFTRQQAVITTAGLLTKQQLNNIQPDDEDQLADGRDA